MPPKKTGNASCTGRDITPLQNYVLNTEQGKGYLATLLDDSNFLENYRLQPNLNECEFSFAKSNWFGVYLQDSEGNKYFINSQGVRTPRVYYFQIIPHSDGGLAIDESTHTYIMPPELVGVKRCVIKNGKCAVEETVKAPKEPKTPAAAKAPKASASSSASAGPLATPAISVARLDPAIEALVQSYKVTAPERAETDASRKIERKSVEAMDLKTLLNWASTHMYEEDLLRCVRSGSLSDEDKAELDAIEGTVPEGGGFTAADFEAVRMAEALPPSKMFQHYKSIASSTIIADINGVPPRQRQGAIIGLCNDAGLNYSLQNYKGGFSIFDPDGVRVSNDEALTTCASVKALQIRSEMQEAFARARGRAGKMKLMKPKPKTSPTQAARLAKNIDFMFKAKEKGDLESIVKFAKNVDFDNIEVSPDGKTLTENSRNLDDEEIEDIIEQMALMDIEKYNVAFGKRKRGKSTKRKSVKRKSRKSNKNIKIFKAAAKHCKGKPNYRKCMSITLKKMHRKSSFGKRCKPIKRGKPITKRKVISNFKCAVRKCKGTSNYRKCMSITLKKIYRKSKFGNDVKKAIKNELELFEKELKDIFTTEFSPSNIKSIVLSPNIFKNKIIDTVKPLIISHFEKFKDNMKDVKSSVTDMLQDLIKKYFDKGWEKIPFGIRITPVMIAGKIVINKILSGISTLITNAGFSKMSFGKRKTIRKSPKVSAKSVRVGTTKRGIDGNMWKVRKTKNGVKRWFKK